MAFAPDYATSGTFYVYYTAQPGGRPRRPSDLVISEFRAARRRPRQPGQRARRAAHPAPARPTTTTAASCSSGPTACSTSAPATAAAATIGNGRPRGNDADPGTTRSGKLLRIDPRPGSGCDGPRTIPFAGNPGFAQPEIWAFGLRNPWRFSFDRATGDLVIGDVGQDAGRRSTTRRHPARGRASTTAGSCLEGPTHGPGGAPPRRRCVDPVLEKGHARRTASRSRAATSSAIRRCPTCSAATSTPTPTRATSAR